MARAEDRLIIAGGGLSGCLAALALAELRPEVSVLLLESAARFGGNHIWSFFDADVDEDARWLVDPLVEARWEAYDVRFPKRRRTLPTPYNSLTSARLDRLMRERLTPDRYRLGSEIETIAPDHVRLAGGESIAAAAVIDARGAGDLSALDLGWQKFVGREYRFEKPHGLLRPIVMDATVDQADGYRFVYCLPFSDTRMLVEDTYYSLSPALDPADLGERIEAYMASQGWLPAALEREESGVLPVAMGGTIAGIWNAQPGVPKLGLRGGFFHPMTGYSLPDAVRTALLVARQRDLGAPALHDVLRREAARLWRERGFYRLLSRMLFRAAAPPERYRVLEHFYRLDAALIDRFYAGRTGLADKIRILSGKPPVPVSRALAALHR
jgi:lycopene beta-cyclase